MCMTPRRSAWPLRPHWLFAASGGAAELVTVCVLSRGQYSGTGSCGWGDLWFHNELLSVVELWSSSLQGQRSIVCSSGQQRRPDWSRLEAPQGKHLLDASVCLPHRLSVCPSLFILYFCCNATLCLFQIETVKPQSLSHYLLLCNYNYIIIIFECNFITLTRLLLCISAYCFCLQSWLLAAVLICRDRYMSGISLLIWFPVEKWISELSKRSNYTNAASLPNLDILPSLVQPVCDFLISVYLPPPCVC